MNAPTPRLVVVSNRIGDPRKPSAGGLAVALGDTLANSGGLWFGWSGKIVEGGAPGEGEVHQQRSGSVQLVTIDLSRPDHDAYYAGYSNQALWPAFHYRLDLADFGAGFFAGYQRVNRLFARKLAALLRPDDMIWVHDYHLFRSPTSCGHWAAGSASGSSCTSRCRRRPSSRRFPATNG